GQRQPDLFAVQQCRVSTDHPALFQPTHSLVHRGYRQSDTFGEFGETPPAVTGKLLGDRLVQLLQRFGVGHGCSTINSCGRVLSSSTPSSVTNTMSSMRAPHFPSW